MTIAYDDKSAPARPAADQKTMLVVTHTHWDREWYLPFQNYRFRLVRLIDKVLDILATTPDFGYFTLDGQTIVLEDYLEIRPEREAELKKYISEGRLLVGPWYMLPDQFLISGEAHIQNMLHGQQIAARFGAIMPVGYSPDPFGHIGQMPQILQGLGINSAIFWRGVGEDVTQTEFLWQAPDGSTVETVHLPNGYSNALAFNAGMEAALNVIDGSKDNLIKRSTSGYVLMMNGNDHAEPTAQLPELLRQLETTYQERGLNYRFEHSNMLDYIQKARATGVWRREDTPRHTGEFRDCKTAHLLPGVLSARMWIKQWNARCENLLEREAGPALAWSSTLTDRKDSYDPASSLGLYKTAWKYLLQNDPHDSICGCSIDQVHDEMKTRYAWTEQVGTELRDQALRELTQAVDTQSVAGDSNTVAMPVVVFNNVPGKRTEVASLTVSTSEGVGSDLVVMDGATGQRVPHTLRTFDRETLFTLDIPASAFNGMVAQADDDGRVMGYTMADYQFTRTLDNPDEVLAEITAVYNSAAPTDPALMAAGVAEAQKFVDEGVKTFKLTVYQQSKIQLDFLAKDVPANGYKTFVLRPRPTDQPKPHEEKIEAAETIENEFYVIEVDAKTGTLNITDKETGAVYKGCNSFRDGGDAGDEYNYSPPANDNVITNFFASPQVIIRRNDLEQSIELNTAIDIPYGLSDDRQSRQKDKGYCPMTTVVTLVNGQRRIDFETYFNNKSKDHRLQVLFPAPFVADSSQAEGAFDVVTRPVALPKFDRKKWIEDPMPQAPQKSFVSINDAERKLGLTVINRGLPEYEIVPPSGEQTGSAIAITLLRCVGWLSRDDFQTRRYHAGPALPTPGAQELGEHYFRYAVMPHKGDWLVAGAQIQAHNFNQPLLGVVAAVQPGPLPAAQSFMEVLPRALALSTIKRSEDGRGVVVRLWNPAQRDIPLAKVRFYREPARVEQVNLAEQSLGQTLTADPDGFYSFPAAAKKIITLWVEF